jgi:ketosteroid isomerase-like protein
MSEENVEIVKGFTSRFEAGDREELLEHFDPDVVLDMSASGQPAAGVYHGHEGVERFFRDWLGRGRTTRLRPASTSMRGTRWLLCFARAGPAGAAG